MTERNVNLTQEIISGLENKKQAGHLQQLNFRSSSFWACQGDTDIFPAGKERGEKTTMLMWIAEYTRKSNSILCLFVTDGVKEASIIISCIAQTRNNL